MVRLPPLVDFRAAGSGEALDGKLAEARCELRRLGWEPPEVQRLDFLGDLQKEVV